MMERFPLASGSRNASSLSLIATVLGNHGNPLMLEESVAPQETKCKNLLFQLIWISFQEPIELEVTMPFVWSFILLLLLPIYSFSQTIEKPVIPDDVLWEPDIEYLTAGAKAVNLAMDVVTPKGSGGPYPAVVCIHGGGFRKGERQSQLPLCIKLAKRGYVAATISYRLSPRDQFPAPVHDVKTAIRFLRANAVRFNIDPAHIGVTGFSAGGHLALFLGLTAGIPEFEGPGPYREQSSQVQCVVNFYGPTDFTKSYGKSVDAAEVLPLFLGGDLEHERLTHIQASPLNWVTPNASPVLTIHGTEDRYVAYEQAVWITERLKSAGVESELLTLEGAGHGFKGADAEKAEKRLIEFMDSHLKAPTRETATYRRSWSWCRDSGYLLAFGQSSMAHT